MLRLCSKKNAILKSPARTVQPAAPKKSARETFARGLGIANGMISLITGVENLENN